MKCQKSKGNKEVEDLLYDCSQLDCGYWDKELGCLAEDWETQCPYSPEKTDRKENGILKNLFENSMSIFT